MEKNRIKVEQFCAKVAPVGDINSTAKGSGARYNRGKPDFSLIPLSTLEDEARVWMHGAKKYSRGNWKKGMAWSVPLACLMRHMAAWQAGEDTDPESGLPHLAHAACNLRMLTYYAKEFKEGDDRDDRPGEAPDSFLPTTGDDHEALTFHTLDGGPA